jgi:hypothetical protein
MEKEASGISPFYGAALLAGLVGRRPVDSYRHSIFVKPMARRLSNQVSSMAFMALLRWRFHSFKTYFP